MGQIPSPIVFVANATIKSADVNTNFAAINTAFNGTAVLTDTPTTIAVTHTWSVSQTFKAGITVSGAATFSSGVTFASGTTVTVSGLNVTGNFTFASGITITASGVTVTGNVTFSATLAASSITVDGGVLVVAGVNASIANATFVAGAATSGVTTFVLAALAGNAMKAQSDGSVILGTTVATSATLGYVYLPTASATSTGIPATQSGLAAVCFETGNSHLQIWNPVASAWRTVALT